MKKIFRKNQLMITALALMLAVAGYFSFMNHNINDPDAAAEASADALKEDFEISDEDILSEGDIFTPEEGEVADGAEPSNEGGEVASGETPAEGTDLAANGENAVIEDGINPGEAVLTSSTVTNIDYASEMKLSREQVRSKNKETLLEIVNNGSVDNALKQDAINKMIALTDIAERENAAEMLLEAKGFTDVVVSITDNSCDVVLNMGEVTDAKRAQIEDIVKRKTNIAGENIIITPIVIGETDAK